MTASSNYCCSVSLYFRSNSSIVILMLAKIYSSAVVGLDAVGVTVETDIASQGLPSFAIVGLPDKAVEESKERVRAAIRNGGAESLQHRPPEESRV